LPTERTAPAAFSEKPYVAIPMMQVKSNQVAAIGYDPVTKTLAVTFTRGPGNVYHYPNVEPETHAAFIGAESIGTYFGKHIKPLPFDKFPAPKLDEKSKPEAATEQA
jgi:hypothetical protein